MAYNQNHGGRGGGDVGVSPPEQIDINLQDFTIQPPTLTQAPALSPLEISKLLLSLPPAPISVVSGLGSLRRTVEKTLKVLKRYADILDKSRITPSHLSGFNLEQEIATGRPRRYYRLKV